MILAIIAALCIVAGVFCWLLCRITALAARYGMADCPVCGVPYFAPDCPNCNGRTGRPAELTPNLETPDTSDLVDIEEYEETV